jgi:hypothetical protein
MTVTTTANSIRYAGNGTTTAFSFPYIFFAPTDLVVSLVDEAAGALVTPPPVLNGGATYDYTIAGDFEHGEYPSGGTVTFNTAPITGYVVSLVRAVPAVQTVTLIDNTKFPAETINTEFDYLTVLAQQTSAVTTVALHIPDDEVGLNVQAAPHVTRANKILAWDAAGNLIHSEKDLSAYDDVDEAHFDLRYVNKAGDNMSGPLSVPFLTTNNATINTSLQVMPGGTANVPTPGVGDVSTKAATTAWVVGLLGAQGQGEAIYKFGDSTVSGDPGAGYMDIQIGGGIDRTISMSKLDADGTSRFLIAMTAGDAIVVTNELTPVTQYARYTLITDVTDNGTWVQFNAHLNDSSSPAEAPPHDTRLRVIGFLNTMSGGASISGVSAGYGLTGGGSSGVIPIAADPTVLAPLASPVFTGNPTAPTPISADNDSSIATTAFVKAQGYTTVAASDAAYLKLSGGTLTGPLAGTSAAFGSITSTGAITAFSGTAIPAGGTLGTGLTFTSTANFGVVPGSGVPNKAMPKGTLYLRSDGTGTPYYNSDGTAGGWLQVGAGGGSATHVGTSPPPTPTDGQLWFYSDASIGGGQLYIYYNDLFGSPQWVPASPGVGSGAVVQTVSTQTGAVTTATVLIPWDDTIPQITEGTEFMTLAITPRSATSQLIINVQWCGSNNAINNIIVALFRDATANALATTFVRTPVIDAAVTLPLQCSVTSGSTSTTTFRVRVGCQNSGTTTMNGSAGVRLLGGALLSSIVIQEVL